MVDKELRRRSNHRIELIRSSGSIPDQSMLEEETNDYSLSLSCSFERLKTDNKVRSLIANQYWMILLEEAPMRVLSETKKENCRKTKWKWKFMEQEQFRKGRQDVMEKRQMKGRPEKWSVHYEVY